LTLGWTTRAVRRKRVWLLLGLPLAALAALSTIASISFLPPSIHSKSIAYAIASSELSVETSSSSGNTPELTRLYPLPEWAAVLAEEMTSPQMRGLIAKTAGIPANELAIDGPVSADLQRTQQEPTGEKRSYQLLAEGDLYRVTLDTDKYLPAIAIAAQAPSEDGALELVEAVDRAAHSYLTSVETSAHTAPPERVHVSPLQPVVITGGSGGHTVAALVFLLTYVLWTGGVFVWVTLARDMRALRRLGWTLPAQVPPAPVRSSIENAYVHRPAGSRREH
jgi:hypothetical protein